MQLKKKFEDTVHNINVMAGQ